MGVKHVSRVFLLLLGVIAPALAPAASVTIQNVKIESFRSYFTLGVDVSFEVILAPGTTLSTGCAITDSSRIFTYSSSSSANYPIMQMLEAQAAYVDAQGRNVDLTYESSQCHATRGATLSGIRARPGS